MSGNSRPRGVRTSSYPRPASVVGTPALMLCIAWSWQCFANAEDMGIFFGSVTTPPGNGEPALRLRAVDVDLERLRGIASAHAAQDEDALRTTVRLNLFEDVVLEGVVEYAERTGSGHALFGVLKDMSPSSMAIAVRDGFIVGEIHTADAAYLIRTSPDGRHVLVREVELASRSLEALGCGTEVGDRPEGPEDDRMGSMPEPGRENFDDLETPVPPPSTVGRDSEVPDEPAPGPGPVHLEFGRPAGHLSGCGSSADELPGTVDLLVAYTGAARARAGGSNQIRASIDLGVGITNQALRDSGARVRIRLVGTTEIAYAETGVSATDLSRFSGTADGHMDSIHAMRNACLADLVHLIVAESDVGGLGDLGGPFGLTAYDALGTATLAHEIGHNFGLHHDRYQLYVSAGRDEPTSYEHGYVNLRGLREGAPRSSRWRTIMSYRDRCHGAGIYCATVRYYSNPGKRYNGDPMGVPGEHHTVSVDGPADAVRTITGNASRAMNRRMGPTRVRRVTAGSLTMDLLLREDR